MVFHIDVNSAFLSWTAIKILNEGGAQDIRTVPSVVSGDPSDRRSIITAASIPAKKILIILLIQLELLIKYAMLPQKMFMDLILTEELFLPLY